MYPSHAPHIQLVCSQLWEFRWSQHSMISHTSSSKGPYHYVKVPVYAHVHKSHFRKACNFDIFAIINDFLMLPSLLVFIRQFLLISFTSMTQYVPYFDQYMCTNLGCLGIYITLLYQYSGILRVLTIEIIDILMRMPVLHSFVLMGTLIWIEFIEMRAF